MKPIRLLLAAVLALAVPALSGTASWAQEPPVQVPGAPPPGNLPETTTDADPPENLPAIGESQPLAEEPPPLPPFAVPTGVSAADTPNDIGGSIRIRWEEVEGATGYRIERAEPDSAFATVGDAGAAERLYDDESVENGKPYIYRVVVVGPGGAEGVSAATAPATASPQWFKGQLTGVLLAVLAFMALVIWFIQRARRGEDLFIRRIAGLEAVEEAVGRATEMGRPVLYIPGTGYISDIATIASLNVLGEIAKKTAEYGTKINVPVRDPIVYTVAREVVRGAYTSVGRPDAYDSDSVYFLVEHALAYAAAVSGVMVREKPATNFLLGTFYGESLILAETGASTGAIQIAGTDQTTQLPFFVVACDYTLMGEELYAASAYLSREPLMLGALKGEDMGKLVFMIILVVGTVLMLAFGVPFDRILSTSNF